MLIAIDYDDTITLDRAFWSQFIDMAIDSGHQIIIATGRKVSEPVMMPGVEVVYAGDELKRVACERAGYQVDIWIDDEPGHIEPCRKLQWDGGRPGSNPLPTMERPAPPPNPPRVSYGVGVAPLEWGDGE